MLSELVEKAEEVRLLHNSTNGSTNFEIFTSKIEITVNTE